MTLTVENILLFGSMLLFLSIIASKTSFKLGIPALILFLVVGMLAGSDGPGGIYFDDPKFAQFLGVVALTFILFSGGLETKWESIRPIVWQGVTLSTLGVFLTALTVGIFAAYLLNYPWYVGMLLGSIVSSTDAAAVFSILRSKSLGLKGHLRPTLEFESGSNDPMAYFLTTGFIYLIADPDASLLSLAGKFVIGMTLGAMCGYALGKVMVWTINHIQLDVDGLYPVLILALVFFTFSFTDTIGGNGFLAVYIAAIVLGNSNFLHKKSLTRFYDGQAWLMQIVMFLTLGLLAYPSKIMPYAGQGILLSLFLIFVARPVSIFACLLFFRDLNIRKKLFISWVGLRGAVPIIFSIYPMIAGIPYANSIFNLVFFISVSSVLLQGTTLPMVARWLSVSVPEQLERKSPIDLEMKDNSNSELVELDVADDSSVIGKPVVELNLPKSSMIVLIHRDGKYITASGDTQLQAHDHLLIMADSKKTVNKVYARFNQASVQ